ncbi:hypothetical protein GCM10017557_52330 [Streptomyces aurantiacus]|uniref:Uncharacterized protein n=1 Tax=Streptomyces aurantiacus TaxID=47760 RepID=A0A7G1P921_9ACTN|nr:hypothetical protein GCM10017557_52330 [Streptomyces aurantiacus]
MEDGTREAEADETHPEGAFAGGDFAGGALGKGGVRACASHALHLNNAVAKVQAKGTMGAGTRAPQGAESTEQRGAEWLWLGSGPEAGAG